MRKLAIFSFAFSAAAALSVWILPTEYLLYGAVMGAAVGFLSFFLRNDHGKRCRLAAFGLAFGLVWAWGYEHFVILPGELLTGEEQTITGTVVEAPTAGKSVGVTVKIGGRKLKLWLDADPAGIEIGDQITVCAEILPVSGRDDTALSYQSKDIFLMGFQRGKLTVNKPDRLPLSCYPAYWGDLIRQRITEIFPEDVSGFLRALLTGDRSGLTYEQTNALSVTGISHVVAVSGMHVSLIAGIIFLLFPRKRRLSAGLGIAVMVLFAAMVGFTPSVTRAVIMNSLILLAPMFDREEDLATCLGFALMLILLNCPKAIASVSLQLSFLAMVGIYWLTPRIYRWMLTGLRRESRRHPIRRRLFQGMAATLSATLGACATTIPLSAAYFGVVSVIAPLTNLLTGAVLSLVFSLSVPAVLLSLLPPLGQLAAWGLAWPVRYVLAVVKALARLPHSAVYTESSLILIWLGTAYAILALYIFGKDRKPAVLGATLVVTLAGGIIFSGGGKTAAGVTVFDVGQGQCVLLRCGEKTALVDCGGDRGDSSGEEIVRKLLANGIYEVDYLILTHFDTDHVCGAAQLMRRMEVGGLYMADTGEKRQSDLLSVAQEEDVPVTILFMDLQMEFGGGTLKLFVPPEKNAENASLSALMSVEEYDILVTGDMDSGDEARLVKTHDLPDLEVLVAGHHGSKHSTGEVLLRETAPDVVLISVGENAYGHPAQAVLDRIAACGAEVYRTDLNGDITVSR